MYRIILFIISVAFSFNIAAQTVYTTKTGEKYHKSNCRYLKYSKKELTIEKAVSFGYQACSICKPVTKNKTASTKSKLLLHSKLTIPNTKTKKNVTSQCTGKTKSGSRCKRKTKNANTKCYQHQ
ncbi:hypothetical protein A8C32_12470 [Flavivirga aquatica]|uniref:Ada DNA repair metal-binding domain-containing protein n=1 Tax=Flavivirga aquatica TaxID=1849968 RepID=A0A1E5TDR3_9FLAO|nr:hypothetical protein [Flavivirga aquatica]OEK09516.1 hypothetical protein A8C32_12470 [Flavivirga aquatica]